MIRAARFSGRPILIGEFHIGVPADGLAAGLVQAKDQAERGIAYRYYVEQALAAVVSGSILVRMARRARARPHGRREL